MFSYKPRILSADGVDWCRNALCFADSGEAEEYVDDLEYQLECRGTAIRTVQVVVSDDPPTHRLINGEPEQIVGLSNNHG